MKRTLRTVFLACVLAGLAGTAFATELGRGDPTSSTVRGVAPQQIYNVRVWTTSDGLPLNNVQTLLQARNGYLWIGTQGGLARFDGRRFTRFTSADNAAFRKDSVLSLAEGPDGALWVGTVAGIVCYRSNRFEHVAVPHRHPDGRRVNGISVSASGEVWAATFQGPGRVQAGQFIPDLSFPAQTDPRTGAAGRETFAIQANHGGNIVSTGPAGVYNRDPATGAWRKVDDQGGHRMLTAANGIVWIVDPVLNKVVHGQSVHRATMGGPFQAGASDLKGRIWVSSRRAIYEFDGDLKAVPMSSELPGEVKTLLVDREGNIWAGTSAGLACLSPAVFKSLTTGNGLVHHDVWSISEAPDGALWIGTDGGVSCYRLGTIANYAPCFSEQWFSKSAHAVLALKNGEVWTSPGGVLCRLYPLPPEFPRGADGQEIHERPVYADPDGSIWMESLTRWHHGKLVRSVEAEAGVGSIVRDPVGRLWIGTRGAGLIMIDVVSTNRFTTTNGLTSNFCGPVLADTDGAVWIVSDKGLNRWKNGEFSRFTVGDGLPEGFILNVLEDDLGWLWLNGHQGIYRVRKQHLVDFAEGRRSRFSVVAYDEDDGLPSAEGNGGWLPNSCKTRDGRLWFPTTRGVAVVDPAEISTTFTPPVPVITDITSGDEKIFSAGTGLPDLASEVRLAAGSGDTLRINYTAPTFAPNSQVRFEHQLEPQNKNWIDGYEEGFALYTNLRPGRYRFQVRAVSRDGTVGPAAILALRIAPFFYQTWWFYVLSGTGLAGLVGILHTRRLAVQRRILRLEQQSALEQERARISADIHDALGADLSRITFLSERLRQDQPSACQAATAIADAIRGMGTSISELIWATNSRNDSLDNLLSYIREQAAKICTAADIRLVADIAPVPPLRVSGFVRHNVYLVIREALTNALKHAQATEVRLRVAFADQALEVELADNGRGFSPEDLSRWNNGQRTLRKRAEDIGATLQVCSSVQNGTSVRLRLPLPPNPSEASVATECLQDP